MAGNGLIRMLRCNSASRASSSSVLLEGQPMYETDTKYFYIGDGTTQAKNLEPISSGGSALQFDSSSFNVSEDTVTLKGATQTTLGGIKAWMSSDGTLYISTEE